MATANFNIFLAKNRFFRNSKSQLSKLVQLSHYHGLGMVNSGLPFAYSMHGVLFPISSKIATDLLENFQAKNLYFQKQFPSHHIALCVTISLLILIGLGTILCI